jgi:hypothetical protein
MEKMEKLKAIRDKISQNLVLCESENKDLEKDEPFTTNYSGHDFETQAIMSTNNDRGLFSGV